MIQKWYNARRQGSLRLKCSFYAGPSGAEPVRDWLRALAKDIRVEIGTDVGRVQRLWPVSRPLVGSLGQGLYEVVTTITATITAYSFASWARQWSSCTEFKRRASVHPSPI